MPDLTTRDVSAVVTEVVELLLADEFGVRFDELIDRNAGDPCRIERPGDLPVESFVDDVATKVAGRLKAVESRRVALHQAELDLPRMVAMALSTEQQPPSRAEALRIAAQEFAPDTATAHVLYRKAVEAEQGAPAGRGESR